MITLCVMPNSVGSFKEKFQMLCTCILLDMVYIAPMAL